MTCAQSLSVFREGSVELRLALFNATTIEYAEPEVVEEIIDEEETVGTETSEDPENTDDSEDTDNQETSEDKTDNTEEHNTVVIETKVVDIKKAVTEIDNWIVVAGNNRSKWKDVSGNFNTARLASDLTAGVVLGTVGGVVSGVVIKKKQVEKGFDALNCYVAGQKMAGWSDEFRIEFHK